MKIICFYSSIHGLSKVNTQLQLLTRTDDAVYRNFKTYSIKQIKHYLLQLTLILVIILLSGSIAKALTYYSIKDGDWTSPSTWSTESHGSTVNSGSYPTVWDDVMVGNHSITVMGDQVCLNLTVDGAYNSTITVWGKLTVCWNVYVNSSALGSSSLSLFGWGTLSCLRVTVGSPFSPSNTIYASASLRSYISNLIISQILYLKCFYYSDPEGKIDPYGITDAYFEVYEGNVTVNDRIECWHSNTQYGQTVFRLGYINEYYHPTLNLGGATPFSNYYRNQDFVILNGTGATVNYNGPGTQSVRDGDYKNLILSNGGTKNIGVGGGAIHVSDNLAITGATANFDNSNSTAAYLTLGDIPQSEFMSWGSTASSAIHQNNTYFAGSGVLNACPSITANISGTATICNGESTNLFVRITGGTGPFTVVYNDGINDHTVKDYTSAHGIPVSPASNTTYTLTSVTSAGGCTAITSGKADVTVIPVPEAPISASATNTTICYGESSILSVTGGSGETLEWYSGSCEGTHVGTGHNLTVSPEITTTYYARYENRTCVSSCVDVTVTVKTKPTAGTISGPSSVCLGSGGISYSAAGINNATSYTWAYSGTGATINGTTNPVTIDFTSDATSGNLTVRGNNDCGEGTISANFPITFLSGLPATGVIICRGAASSPMTAECTRMVDWYTQPSGGTLVESASFFDPVGDDEVFAQGGIYANLANTGTPGIYPFYAECQSGNGCRTKVDFVILSVAQPDVTGFGIVCATSPVLAGSKATITVNAPGLEDGTYEVTYDLSGSNYASQSTALLNISSHTGSFTTSNLTKVWTTTITVTSVKNASCSTWITSGNTADIVVGSASLSAFIYKSSSFPVPNCVSSLIVEAWGGGAGGSNTTGTAGGGGGGAYTKGVLSGLTGGSSMLSVTVGAGGEVGVPGSATTVSFGSNTITANGGSTGYLRYGGAGGNTSPIGGIVIASFAGGSGGDGASSSSSNTEAGGGGGGSAYTNDNGDDGSNGGFYTDRQTSGGEGSGAGGAGASGDGTPDAGAGSAPGGGGGGRGEYGGTSKAGAAGQVIVTYDCPSASISYSASTFTTNDDLASATINGSTCGTFSAVPAGLAINSSTGEIDPSSSNKGIYTIHYQISTGFCFPVDATFTIAIVDQPVITVGLVSDFGDQCINTPSVEKSYTVSGSSLTSDIVITPPSGFEISTTSGSGFVNTAITLTQTGGSVLAKPIYVRFSPTIAGAASFNITHSSTGATNENVAVTGNGIEVPTTATNPNPANGASDVSFTGLDAVSSISWDEVPGATSYDVYFDEGSLPASFTTVSTNSYPTGALSASTTYHWKVVPKNECGETTGTPSEWAFTTSECIPPTATIEYEGVLCATGTKSVTRTGQEGGTYSAESIENIEKPIEKSASMSVGLIIDANTGTIDLSASFPGTYIVTYSFADDNGCSNIATAEVKIYSLPEPLALTGSEVCAGETTTITSTSSLYGVNYQLYNSSNSPVGPVKAGTYGQLTWSYIDAGTGYYVIGTDAITGCVSVASNNVNVVVKPMPTFGSISVLPSVVCLGEDVATSTISGLLDGETTFNLDMITPQGVLTGVVQTNTVTDGTLITPYTLRFAGEYKIKINSITIDGCTTVLTENNEVSWSVLPDAEVTSVTGTSPLCIGAKANYTANDVELGGGSDAWSSSNELVAKVDASTGEVTALASGTCNIIYTVTGCNGLVSASQELTVNSLLVCSITGNDGPVCVNRTEQYSAPEGMTSYSWSASGNATIISSNEIRTITILTGTQCGTAFTLTVTVTDANGCTSTCTKTVAGATPQPVDVTGPASVSYKTCEFENQEALNTVYQAWENQFRVVQAGCGGNTTDLNLFYPPDIITGHINVVDYTLSDGCTSDTHRAIFTVEPATEPAIDNITATANPICSNGETTLVANGVGGTEVTVTWYKGSISQETSLGTGSSKTVTGPGTYYAIVTGYCNPAEASITINEIPQSAVESVTGTSLLCVGSTDTYIANGVVSGKGTVKWFSSDATVATVSQSGLVSAIGAGTADITCVIENGCNGNVSAFKTLTVNSAPTFTLQPENNLNVCAGGGTFTSFTATAAGTGTISYLWYKVGANPDGSDKEVSNGGPGFNTLTLSPATTADAGYYYVNATNDCGSTKSNVVQLTIENTPPQITCPDNITVNNNPGDCSAVVTYTAPVGTDNCRNPVTTQIAGLPSGSAFPVGVTTNRFIVTDGAGSTATCYFTVTVVDNQVPVIICPADLTNVKADPGKCSATLNVAPPTVTDNCDYNVFAISNTELIKNGTFNGGVSNWKDCGNKAEVETEEFYIVPLPPNSSNYVAEVDKEVSLCQNISGFVVGHKYVLTFKASRRQNTGTPNPVSANVIIDGDALSKVVTRTNTIFDLTPESFEFTATQTTHKLTFTPYTDNIKTLGLIVDDISIMSITYPVGPTTLVWTATDVHGNTNTCEQVITILDNEAPALMATLPGGASGNLCKAAAPTAPDETAIAALYSDNCTGGITASLFSSSIEGSDCSWTATYTYRVKDAADNYAPDAIVVYTGGDNTAPVLANAEKDASTLNQIGVNLCEGAFNGESLIASVKALYTDNCTAPEDLVVELTGTTPGINNSDGSWSFTYEYTITNLCEKFTTCEVSISGGDKTPPTALCKNVVVYLESDGNVAITAGDINNGSFDNCSGEVTMDISRTHFSYSDLGTDCSKDFNVTLTVTDESKNQSECTSVVTIKKRPTKIVYSGPGSSQYSDPVNMSATLYDITPNSDETALADKTVSFTIDGQSASDTYGGIGGGTNASGLAESTIVLGQSPHNLSVVSNFTGDNIYCGSTDSDPFTVTCEDDISVTTDNNETYFTANPTTGKGDVWFRAYVVETDDSPGNIANAKIDFMNELSSPPSVINPAPALVTPIAGEQKVVSVYTLSDYQLNNTEMTTTGGHAWLVRAQTGTGSYYCGKDEGEPVVFVLAMPGGDFVTGGGKYIHTQSAGVYAATAGTWMNFGFNMKWNKSGKNLQGNINVVFRTGSKIYHIKSNAINALAVSQITQGGLTYNTGIMTTKANLTDITDPLNPLNTPYGGNLNLKVVVWDATSVNGGSADKITVELTASDNTTLIYSSYASGINLADVIKGGNINVRNTSGIYVPPTCGAPTNVLATNLTQNSAQINWDAVENSTATCNVLYKENSSTDWITAGTVDASINIYLLDNLIAGTSYDVKVVRNCSTAAESLVLTFTTTAEETIPLPTECIVSGLTAITDGTNKVTLTWAPISSEINDPPVTYKVEYRKLGSTTWTTINSAIPNLVLSNLSTSTTYQWQVTPSCGSRATVGTNFTTGKTRVKAAEIATFILPEVEFADLKVYPNPFSERLRFEFVSPETVDARIELYDLTGRLVKTIFEQPVEGGTHYESEFRPDVIISAIYFYRVTLGDAVFNGKVIFKKE